MSSLKPKEGGTYTAPTYPPTAKQSVWIPVVLAVVIVAVAAIAYGEYTTKAAFETKIATLEEQVAELETNQGQDVKKLQASAASLASDVNSVSKKVGATAEELNQSKQITEKLRQEQDRQAESREQLAKEVSTKASSTDVAAARDEAAKRAAELQNAADSKIVAVSNDVKTVATNLEATNRDLATSRRELVDVKNTLADQIAHNSSEISELRKKGEREYFEFDIKKEKKGVMKKVADIQLALNDTDPKKNRYAMTIQVDDNKLDKKDLTINQPVQFLVGRDKLRYEIVVNVVDKDRIRGYLSAPKDKSLAAERPAAR